MPTTFTSCYSSVSGKCNIEWKENCNTQGNQITLKYDQSVHHVTIGNHFNGSATSYKSVTGALYIFPGWLKHSVQGNLSNTDRISVSFNYGPSVRNFSCKNLLYMKMEHTFRNFEVHNVT